MKKNKKMTNINALIAKKHGNSGTEQRTKFSIEAILMNFEAELNDIPVQNMDYRLEKMQEILTLIKAIRKEAGMTQKELAEKAGMKESYVSRVENNKADIQLSSFFKILSTLGLDFRLSVS